MNNTEAKETKFDEVDAIIASALTEESAWPAPADGFEERLAARVGEIVAEAEKEAGRREWTFTWARWARLAAIFLVVLGFAVFFLPVREGAAPAAGEQEGASAALARSCGAGEDLYEEVVESYEFPDNADDKESIIDEATRKLVPNSPMKKILRTICVAAATKLSGV